MTAMTSALGTCIRQHRFGDAAGLPHLLDGLLHRLGPIDRDQLCAFPGEQQRSRAADAAAGAGDDDGFALQAAHAFLPCGAPRDACRATEFQTRFQTVKCLETRSPLTYSDIDTGWKGFDVAAEDKPNVVTTRWWWVRHAPVRNDGGNIYGQSDLPCDTSDTYVFNAVAKVLPREAVWYSSNLMRTHQTAEAIWAAGFRSLCR